VTLVITGEPQKIEQATIGTSTTSPADCQALKQGRALMNAKPGVAFYKLSSAQLSASDMGFGVVNSPTTPTLVSGVAQMDLHHNGHPQVFSSCATSEGIKFSVWTDKAYQGEPSWTGYNYLGYDITPTCPSKP
jgi:hypothetical protein